MTNLSIKKKLLVYSFFIQIVVLFIFSFSIYKSLEITTLDKFQATLKVIILDVIDDLREKDNILNTVLNEEKEYNFEPLYIRILDNSSHEKLIQTSNFPNNISYNDNYLTKEPLADYKKQPVI